jgi:hypothetical protein
MDCTDAYREALIRDLSARASSTRASAPAPSQRHATEADREGAAGPAVGRRTHPEPDDLEICGVGQR